MEENVMQIDQREGCMRETIVGRKGAEKEGEADRGREWNTWEKRAD